MPTIWFAGDKLKKKKKYLKKPESLFKPRTVYLCPFRICLWSIKNE